MAWWHFVRIGLKSSSSCHPNCLLEIKRVSITREKIEAATLRAGWSFSIFIFMGHLFIWALKLKGQFLLDNKAVNYFSATAAMRKNTCLISSQTIFLLRKKFTD